MTHAHPIAPTCWRVASSDMNHSCVRHKSFMCVTWLIRTPNAANLLMCHLLRHDSFICVTRLIYVCDMSHIHTTWFTYTPLSANMLKCHLRRHDSLMYVTRHIYVIHYHTHPTACDSARGMTDSCVTWLIHVSTDIFHNRTSHVTHKNVWNHICKWVKMLEVPHEYQYLGAVGCVCIRIFCVWWLVRL